MMDRKEKILLVLRLFILVMLVTVSVSVPAFAQTGQKTKGTTKTEYYYTIFTTTRSHAKNMWGYSIGCSYKTKLKTTKGVTVLSVTGRINKSATIKGLNTKKSLQKEKTTKFILTSKTKYYGWDDGHRLKMSRKYSLNMIRQRYSVGARFTVRGGKVTRIDFFS